MLVGDTFDRRNTQNWIHGYRGVLHTKVVEEWGQVSTAHVPASVRNPNSTGKSCEVLFSSSLSKVVGYCSQAVKQSCDMIERASFQEPFQLKTTFEELLAVLKQPIYRVYARQNKGFARLHHLP